jgi:hypothetical protein
MRGLVPCDKVHCVTFTQLKKENILKRIFKRRNKIHRRQAVALQSLRLARSPRQERCLCPEDLQHYPPFIITSFLKFKTTNKPSVLLGQKAFCLAQMIFYFIFSAE